MATQYKVDSREKYIRNIKYDFIMIKWAVHQEDIKFLNICVPNNSSSNSG